MISTTKKITTLKKLKPFDDDQLCINLYNEYKQTKTAKSVLAEKNNLTLYYYEKCILRGYEIVDANPEDEYD